MSGSPNSIGSTDAMSTSFGSNQSSSLTHAQQHMPSSAPGAASTPKLGSLQVCFSCSIYQGGSILSRTLLLGSEDVGKDSVYNHSAHALVSQAMTSDRRQVIYLNFKLIVAGLFAGICVP